MSVLKQIPHLWWLNLFLEKISEEWPEETDEEAVSIKYFLTFRSPSIETRELAKAQTKAFRNQVVLVCHFEDTTDIYPPRRKENLQKRL